MTYVQVQLIPTIRNETHIMVDVPESEAYPGFPQPALVIYKGRYFGNFSPGWNVVPMSYREIEGPVFEVDGPQRDLLKDNIVVYGNPGGEGDPNE